MELNEVKREIQTLDSNDVFLLLDQADCEGDFASSLSSNSSQVDYDRMAIEAMAEVRSISEEKDSNLHDYKNSKWEGLYNKHNSSQNKPDHIHIIEEDIENEIDSEYSMTLRNDKKQSLLSRINREIEAKYNVSMLNSSKEFRTLNGSTSSISSYSNRSCKGSS